MPVYGPQPPYYPPNFSEQVVGDGEKSLAEAVAMAKTATHDITGSVEEGHAAEIILVVAESEGADLIVIGRRGLSGIERFLMGGVSSSVVSHSRCDVLIVK